MKNNFEKEVKNKINDVSIEELTHALDKEKIWEKIYSSKIRKVRPVWSMIFTHAAAVFLGILISVLFLYEFKTQPENQYADLKSHNNLDENNLSIIEQKVILKEEKANEDEPNNKTKINKQDELVNIDPQKQEFLRENEKTEILNIANNKIQTELETPQDIEIEQIKEQIKIVKNEKKIIHWKSVESKFTSQTESTGFIKQVARQHIIQNSVQENQ